MRLIDADVLPKHRVKILHAFGIYDGDVIFPEHVENAPTIDAAPVFHARWNHDGPDFPGGVDWYSCSNCGNKDASEWMKYCPKCGAKMDGGAGNAAD